MLKGIVMQLHEGEHVALKFIILLDGAQFLIFLLRKTSQFAVTFFLEHALKPFSFQILL